MSAPAVQDERASKDQQAEERSMNLWKRLFALTDPILQHEGFVYTFIIGHMLLNLVLFVVGAAPAWTKAAEVGFPIRAATAIARGGGAMLNYNAALVILVASRSLTTYLRQTALSLVVPFDKAMPAFHSFIGNCLVVTTSIHVLGHIVRYSILRLHGPGFFGQTSLAVSGVLLTIILIAMRSTSTLAVRKKRFEMFYRVHIVGATAFFVLIMLHGSHIGTLKSFMYVLLPALVYIIDRTERLFREKCRYLSIPRESAVIKGGDMVCLRIPKVFPYLAGQYCEVKVPLVSTTQWHPFTIASSPHEEEMLFFIKVNGDWTRQLYTLFTEGRGDSQPVQVKVRGPYGAPAQHVGQYEHVVLISGGVGATPFASITKYAHNYILNYTNRGAAVADAVSDMHTRSHSVRTSSGPSTATLGNSGRSSARHRSRNTSRRPSRVPSRNSPRALSRNHSQKEAHTSAEPLPSRNLSDQYRFETSHHLEFAREVSHAGFEAMTDEQAGQTIPDNVSRPASGFLERMGTQAMFPIRYIDENDIGGDFLHDDGGSRQYGLSSPGRLEPASYPGGSRISEAKTMMLDIPGMEGATADDNALFRYLQAEDRTVNDANPNLEEELVRPEDYQEALGNPELPVPQRGDGSGSSGISFGRIESEGRAVPSPATSPSTSGNIEASNSYGSSRFVFDEDEERVEEETPVRDVSYLPRRHSLANSQVVHGTNLDAKDAEVGGLDLEDTILQVHNTASNAYSMLGMTFGPVAMMRHMYQLDAKKERNSMMRPSMNLMDDAMDASLWQDRILFYLHTVTINWVLLWFMLARFSLVLAGLSLEQFRFDQSGLGVFDHEGLNVADLCLALLLALPILATIVMEICVDDVQTFLSGTIANSFDVFVLIPILVLCVVLHILNLTGVGSYIPHISKLVVFCLWPVLSFLLLWRIIRTIGTRIVLAPYLKSTHEQTKSLDFMWVSKTHEDDLWLLEELLPLAESKIVRLHRFITRHGSKVEPWMLEYEKLPLKTTYSRPDWDEVLGNLVERSRSGTVVGVFFCGPDVMAQAIQQAAAKAMAKSMDNAYQRGYFSKKLAGGTSLSRSESTAQDIITLSRDMTSSRSLEEPDSRRAMEEVSNDSNDEPDASAYGCSVRIAVRVENFS